jgi:hypothetical protein
MWRDVSKKEQQEMLPLAVKFTGDASIYGAAMMMVLDEYPIACEQNLSAQSVNKQAWIGHAAAYLAHELPEYVTREAWGQLTQEQRDQANAMADKAIYEWEQRIAEKDRRLCSQMGIEWVS